MAARTLSSSIGVRGLANRQAFRSFRPVAASSFHSSASAFVKGNATIHRNAIYRVSKENDDSYHIVLIG
jgi:hypothetical protein